MLFAWWIGAGLLHKKMVNLLTHPSLFILVTPNTLDNHTQDYAHLRKHWILGMYQTLLRTVGNSRNIFGIKDDSRN